MKDLYSFPLHTFGNSSYQICLRNSFPKYSQEYYANHSTNCMFSFSISCLYFYYSSDSQQSQWSFYNIQECPFNFQYKTGVSGIGHCKFTGEYSLSS